MTTWVEPAGGRARGPVGLLQAWTQVLVSPRAFFREAVTPGDQGPGLFFALGVVLVEELTRYLLAPSAIPTYSGTVWLDGALFLAISVLLVTPLVLHASAALVTLALLPLADERGTISATVQVVAYAAAPCALAGIPVPAVRVLACAYGFALLVVGLSVVHRLTLPRALAVGAIPGALVYGYGFRGFGALVSLVPALTRLPWVH